MRHLLFSVALLFFVQPLSAQSVDSGTVYQFTMNRLSGEAQSLGDYRGKVILFVNVASECGYTPQYEGLQNLYAEFKDQGLVILGFPSNEFGMQEPGTSEEIANFCSTRFHITFPMFEKIQVKGGDMHPLYAYLTQAAKNGVMDSEVKWNFQKYLVDAQGKLVQVFSSKVKPEDEELRTAVIKLLESK